MAGAAAAQEPALDRPQTDLREAVPVLSALHQKQLHLPGLPIRLPRHQRRPLRRTLRRIQGLPRILYIGKSLW